MEPKRSLVIAALALAGCAQLEEDLFERKLDGTTIELPGTAGSIDTEEGRNRVYRREPSY